jgi:hypothetical protein
MKPLSTFFREGCKYTATALAGPAHGTAGDLDMSSGYGEPSQRAQ